MSAWYRECDHVASVMGKSVVFANIEYPADEPPDEIVIRGVRYVREVEPRGRHMREERGAYVPLLSVREEAEMGEGHISAPPFC